MKLLRFTVLMVFVLLVLPSFCLAGWVGPKEVVKGEWGPGKSQFAIQHNEPEDIFPTTFAVSTNGNVAISEDQLLERVKIYNNVGKLSHVIFTFGYAIVFDSNNNLYVSGAGFRKYGNTGNLVWTKPDITFDALYYAVNDDLIIGYDSDTKQYYTYKPNGDLLKTDTAYPPELPKLISLDGSYYIEYKTIRHRLTLSGNTSEPQVCQDGEGNAYAIYSITNSSDYLQYKVDKYSPCSNLMSNITLPLTIYEKQPAVIHDSGLDEIPPKLVAEYGPPIIDTNGNILNP